MTRRLATASMALAVLMASQAVLGLMVRRAYRDNERIVALWLGNDAITLAVAIPLLVVAVWLGRRGSSRGVLLWLGILGYAIYNYAFYLFGAALNAFFPLYVVLLVLPVVLLVGALSTTEVRGLGARVAAQGPRRLVGGYLIAVATMLGVVWLVMWGAYVFAGRPTPVGPEEFRLVAALDLTLMVPALTIGGALLWRGHPWGPVIGSIAAVQGALYLLVLSVNAAIALCVDYGTPPGELVLWVPLMLLTAAAASVLLAGVPTTAD